MSNTSILGDLKLAFASVRDWWNKEKPEIGLSYVIDDSSAFNMNIHQAHKAPNQGTIGEKIDKPSFEQGDTFLCVTTKGGDGGYPQFCTVSKSLDESGLIISMNYAAKDLRKIGLVTPNEYERRAQAAENHPEAFKHNR